MMPQGALGRWLPSPFNGMAAYSRTSCSLLYRMMSSHWASGTSTSLVLNHLRQRAEGGL